MCSVGLASATGALADILYLFAKPMINSITIYNQGPSEFPEKLTITYEDRPIHINFLSSESSIFKTVPCLHSVAAGGLVIFQSSEIKEPGSEISLEKYVEALKKYLPRYIDLEMRKSTSKMDLVRLYFRINDIPRAKSLLGSMENKGDVRMLDFLIRHKFEVFKDRFHEKFAETAKIGHYDSIPTAKKSVDPDSEPTDGKTHEMFDEFVCICNTVDEHTRFVFSCEMLGVFPSDFYFLIERHLGFASLERSVFFKIQMADILIRRSKTRIATLMLIQASRIVQKESDMVLKRSLVKLALELVTDGSWDSYFRTIIGELEEDEIQTYGLPISVQGMVDSFMFLNRIPSPIAVEFESCSEVFEFKVVKTALKDQFIDQIRILISGGNYKVMGVYDNEEQFYPAYSGRKCSVLHFDCSVHIRKVVLEDGSEICCDKKMHKIHKTADAELVDIASEESCKKMCFAFRNGRACRFYVSADTKISRSETGFCLLVSGETKEVEVLVEIRENIYEKRVYSLG